MGKRAAGKAKVKATAKTAVAAAPGQVDATPQPLVVAPAPSQVNHRNTEYLVAVQTSLRIILNSPEFGDLRTVDAALTDDVPSMATLSD